MDSGHLVGILEQAAMNRWIIRVGILAKYLAISHLRLYDPAALSYTHGPLLVSASEREPS